MDERTITNLVERVDRLQRENRWLKIAMLGAIVLGIGAPLASSSAPPPLTLPETIEAKRIVVADADGRRAELDAQGLRISSPDNKTATLGNDRLEIESKPSQYRIALGLRPGNAPFVSVADGRGETALDAGNLSLLAPGKGWIRLEGGVHGAPAMQLVGKDAKVLFKAP
jgi:hypothetical protein